MQQPDHPEFVKTLQKLIKKFADEVNGRTAELRERAQLPSTRPLDLRTRRNIGARPRGTAPSESPAQSAEGSSMPMASSTTLSQLRSRL